MALVVATTAWLAAPSVVVAVLAAGGLALFAAHRERLLGFAVLALACAVGVALHDGAAAAAAPVWGAGVLVAGALAERALILPNEGQIEWPALVAWLAGLAAVVGCGIAGGTLVLLAARARVNAPVLGLVAGALLAGLPAVLARRWRKPR